MADWYASKLVNCVSVRVRRVSFRTILRNVLVGLSAEWRRKKGDERKDDRMRIIRRLLLPGVVGDFNVEGSCNKISLASCKDIHFS